MVFTMKRVTEICNKYFGEGNVIQIYKMDDKPYWSIALKDRCCQLSRRDVLNMKSEISCSCGKTKSVI